MRDHHHNLRRDLVWSPRAARYEDYAGFGHSTRFVTDAAFRVSETMNLYFGFQGNFGSGPDEMAVVVSFVRTPDQIANLFNVGK